MGFHNMLLLFRCYRYYIMRRTVLKVLSVFVDFLQTGREIYRNSVPRMYQDGFQFEISQCMV